MVAFCTNFGTDLTDCQYIAPALAPAVSDLRKKMISLESREEQLGRRGRGYRARHRDTGVRFRPEPHARSNP